MATVPTAKATGRGRPASGRERLLEAGLKVFAANGFRKTSLDDIAAAAGIAKSTLYNYFKDKADIYFQVCLYAVLDWQNYVKEKVAQAEGPRDKFLTLGRESFGYLLDHNDLRKVLQDDPELFPLFSPSTRYPDVELEAMDMLRDVLKQGIRQGAFRKVPVEPVTQVIFSIYRMFVVQTYLEHPKIGEDQLFEMALNVILEGISAS